MEDRQTERNVGFRFVMYPSKGSSADSQTECHSEVRDQTEVRGFRTSSEMQNPISLKKNPKEMGSFLLYDKRVAESHEGLLVSLDHWILDVCMLCIVYAF